jgi:isocitrate/isopropylmalate dehydrogenase
MLDHLGLPDTGHRIWEALHRTVIEAKAVTPDLGGTAGTNEFAAAIAANLG